MPIYSLKKREAYLRTIDEKVVTRLNNDDPPIFDMLDERDEEPYSINHVPSTSIGRCTLFESQKKLQEPVFTS